MDKKLHRPHRIKTDIIPDVLIHQTTKSPDRLVKELTLYCEHPIVPGKTLMIFDEIQECEEALNSLKYFCDDAPQFQNTKVSLPCVTFHFSSLKEPACYLI